VLHDHPWFGLTIVLRGSYIDINKRRRRCLTAGQWMFRLPWTAHRIELPTPSPCWTLFIVSAPVRDWGFHCPNGWRSWRQYNGMRCQDLE
jgi:hypothetical protein